VLVFDRCGADAERLRFAGGRHPPPPASCFLGVIEPISQSAGKLGPAARRGGGVRSGARRLPDGGVPIRRALCLAPPAVALAGIPVPSGFGGYRVRPVSGTAG